MVLVRRRRLRLVRNYNGFLLLVLVIFLLNQVGEVVVAFAQWGDVRWRHVLELVHVND